MRLNSKLTWGLAWAGLAIVVAVPSLDFITGKGKTAALLTSTTEPVAAPLKTAAVTTTVTPTGITITPSGAAAPADPVNDYLKTSSSLPDYISGGAAASSAEPTQVATAEPTAPVVAPVPFPARPPDTVSPKPTQAAALPAPAAPPPATDSASLYAPDDSSDVAPPIDTADARPDGPVPPEPIDDGAPRNWRGQSLQQYLDTNGLLDNSNSRSTAQVTVTDNSDPNYDPNGFYLSDGPNTARAARRAQVLQMLNGEDSGDSGGAPQTLPNFSLF